MAHLRFQLSFLTRKIAVCQFISKTVRICLSFTRNSDRSMQSVLEKLVKSYLSVCLCSYSTLRLLFSCFKIIFRIQMPRLVKRSQRNQRMIPWTWFLSGWKQLTEKDYWDEMKMNHDFRKNFIIHVSLGLERQESRVSKVRWIHSQPRLPCVWKGHLILEHGNFFQGNKASQWNV